MFGDKSAFRGSRSLVRGGGIVVAMLLGSSGAMAQNCNITGIPGADLVSSLVAGTASAVAGSLGNVSTAFLTQQTSAFVAGATATQPNQTSGGIWARAVGGRVDTKSETTVNAPLNNPNQGTVTPGGGNCSSDVRQHFGGFQAGRDIAQLNWNEWNVHWGATAGYLQSRGDDIGPSSIGNKFEIPFLGSYLVATRGSFFSDIMIRREYYNITLDQPGLNLHNQPFGARGWSVSAGLGYNFQLADGWFAEPSAGFIWSRTEVDAIALGGPVANLIPGTLQVNDIDSKIGRLSFRVGRNFVADGMAWQPFASVSVFREFAGDVTANYSTCTNCVFVGVDPVRLDVLTQTTRVGTFGQFSLGLAGQVLDTGWVGFVRGDYRTGSNIDGWTANAGLRYNFVPDRPAPAHKMVVKGMAPPVVVAYNWSGFYLGGHFGAQQGRGHVEWIGAGASVDPYISGYLLGGQAGFNYQSGAFVVGVEVDVSKTNTTGASLCGSDPGTDANGFSVRFTSLFLTCENDMNWIVTAAARLGMVAPWSDRILFYAKAGGAWTREDVTVGCVYGPNNNVFFGCYNANNVFTNGSTASANTVGGMIGFGSEFGLTRNWSAKAEFNYIRFRDHDVTTSDGSQLNIGAHVTQGKIGVNYRFN
jgi:opacity protein-like surface antigen